MAYFKILFIFLIMNVAALGATPPKLVKDLPLWDADNVVSGDALLFVNSGQSNLTNRLYLWDLVNLPPLAAPSFVLDKPLTGFSPATGTVTTADTVLTAFNKIYANLSAIGGAPITIGAINSQTPASNGLLLDSNILYAQYASATAPGMVSNGTQDFSGQKTFTTGITGTLTGTASGNELPLSFSDGLNRSTNAINCVTASGSAKGCLSSADWSTFNNKQAAITPQNFTAGTGLSITSGTGTGATLQALTVGLANTAVTPGSYTSADITVDAQGRITAAANGIIPSTAATSKSFNVSSHGLSVGNVVRFNGSNWVLSQADDDANSEVYGVVSAVPDSNNFTITTEGYITGLTGLTAGETFFLDSATPGALTSTAPTANGEVSKPVLNADSTTSGFVIQSRGLVIGGGGGGGSGAIYRAKIASSTCAITDSIEGPGDWIENAGTSTGTGRCEMDLNVSFSVQPSCWCSEATTNYDYICNPRQSTTTMVEFGITSAAGSPAASTITLYCVSND